MEKPLGAVGSAIVMVSVDGMERDVMALDVDMELAELPGTGAVNACRAEARNWDLSERVRTCPLEYTSGLCAMGTSGSLGVTGMPLDGRPVD
jgi:hypothetical protein